MAIGPIHTERTFETAIEDSLLGVADTPKAIRQGSMHSVPYGRPS